MKTCIFLLHLHAIAAFVPALPLYTPGRLSHKSTELAALITIELEKPLGIILEEVSENEPKGVKVEEISDAGSAYASSYREELIGSKVLEVMEDNVSSMAFDDVMDYIINAPSPVRLTFEVEGDDVADVLPQVEIGTAVEINVIQEGNADRTLSAKVGDNLRQVLLDNKVEVYRGLKKKLGNCGGGGQCTFCAVDFVESEGWSDRSEYEDNKMKKAPSARLACLNNVQGPATIRVQ